MLFSNVDADRCVGTRGNRGVIKRRSLTGTHNERDHATVGAAWQRSNGAAYRIVTTDPVRSFGKKGSAQCASDYAGR
jgi:hypothetical protein